MIKVLLFSYLQEEYGDEKLWIDKKELTVSELKNVLHHEYHLSRIKEVMIAINEEFAMEGQVIHAGDTVACIPPVSGG